MTLINALNMKKMIKQFLIVAMGLLLLVVSGCSDDDVTREFNVIVKATYVIPTAEQATTTGTVPVDETNYKLGDQVTLLGNTGNLQRTNGLLFAGWSVPGSTAVHQPGSSFTIPMTLPSSTYTVTARWGYTVTYNGNGSDGGTAPVDGNVYVQAATVTVAGVGTLTRTGFIFNGWNTAANGSGTARAAGSTFAMGTAHVTLYAQWVPE